VRRAAAAVSAAVLAVACDARPRVVEAAPARADAPAPAVVRLGPWLEAEAAAGRFSGAVLVARGDQVLHRSAHGFADRAAGTPLTPEHRFRIASLSKQFTAVAVLRLQDRGVLSVDDPVCRWVDPCPEAWRAVTIHHLLSHQSGIPDLMGRAGWTRARWRPWTAAELQADSARLPLEFAPGTNAAYSNAAYNLLGSVVERASGRPFAEQLRADLLDPLGLKDTGYDDEQTALATGYDGADPRRRSNASVVFAAGGLYSTVDDLYRWTRALHGGRVLSERSYRQMIAADPARLYRAVERGGAPQTYAYGLFVGAPGLRVQPGFPDRQLFHTGSWSGFRAYVAHQPERETTVVVLSNDYALGTRLFLAGQRAMAEALGRPLPESLPPRGTGRLGPRTSSSATPAPPEGGPA
jgi:CubicO group peptidase (beta-lactamase class C family)